MNRLKHIFAGLVAALLLANGQVRAETAVWSDNFESNAGNGWTTNNVWQIGVPTVGPAQAYSGSHCAAAGLKASPPSNVDSRLICTNYNGNNWLLVPAVNEYPRLRFWQWYNFVYAQGYVEIRLQSGNTNWQTISTTNFNFSGNSSGVWTRPSLDLSAFAGTNIQIAFHFTDSVSAPGWFVDDVAVVTGQPVFNNPEGFESGLGDWSVDKGTWEVGKPTSGPNQGHNGSLNCAATVLAGNYGNNVDSRLISPPFLVPATGNAALRYYQWYSFVYARGYVEINNGTIYSAGSTNSTVTTNQLFGSFNTNVYQLVGATVAGFSDPFYWNQTIGGWTNATEALGNLDDADGYHFEAGYAPLASIGIDNYIYNYNCTYRATILPNPLSVAATNYLQWQGMTWTNVTGLDQPVGYFATNYTYTYTTNTIVSFAQNNWQTISPTNQSLSGVALNSAGWTNAVLDLSPYANQTVQIAFHLQTGASGTAPGWYVDDISLSVAPLLNVPTNQVVSFGQKLTNTLTASNPLASGATFTFALASASTNVSLTGQGVLTWTNLTAPPGSYVIYLQATDNSSLRSATNSFTVTVQPLSAQLLLTPLLSGKNFNFSVQTPWTNSTWWIEAATNLSGGATNWLPLFTNTPGGTLLFTDLLSTNFPLRYYRAVFP